MRKKFRLKRLTCAAYYAGVALMAAGLITLYEPIGLAAVGAWVFAFVYDRNFRRIF